MPTIPSCSTVSAMNESPPREQPATGHASEAAEQAQDEAAQTPTAPAQGAPVPGDPSPRPARGEREQLARAALSPLGEGEWPRALVVAIAICVLLAIAVLIGAASIHDLRRHGGSLPGAVLLANVLALLAQGMYRRRYWAVLSFEALLAFQIIVTSLALVVASTILAGVICLVSVLLGGWLFWKLVRVMGRLQAGERSAPRHD
jgi:hypothetical protein